MYQLETDRVLPRKLTPMTVRRRQKSVYYTLPPPKFIALLLSSIALALSIHVCLKPERGHVHRGVYE